MELAGSSPVLLLQSCVCYEDVPHVFEYHRLYAMGCIMLTLKALLSIARIILNIGNIFNAACKYYSKHFMHSILLIIILLFISFTVEEIKRLLYTCLVMEPGTNSLREVVSMTSTQGSILNTRFNSDYYLRLVLSDS